MDYAQVDQALGSALGLTVSLGSGPAVREVTRDATNIESLELLFTAPADREYLIRALRLTGAGYRSGAYSRPEDLANVLRTCSLWRGETAVTGPQRVSATRGEVDFLDSDFRVPRGATATIRVVCNLVPEPGKGAVEYALGVAQPRDILALDLTGGATSTLITLDPPVVRNASIDSASVQIRVSP